MNIINKLTPEIIRPFQGTVQDRLSQFGDYSARMLDPVFEKPEPELPVQAWLVQFRVVALTLHEALMALQEEVCYEETRRWTGFPVPKPEDVKFGRLRHLIGDKRAENLFFVPLSRFCEDGDRILAAGDILTAGDFNQVNFCPVLSLEDGVYRLSLLDTMLGKRIPPAIWWLFVSKA